MIKIDQTLLIQFVLFVTFMLVLNRVLFRPFLKFFEERHTRIYGTQEEAERLKGKTEGMISRYEEELKEGRLRALEEKLKIREEAKQKAREIIEEVQGKIQKEIPVAREQIRKETEKALEELKGRSEEMAREVAEKILGRSLA